MKNFKDVFKRVVNHEVPEKTTHFIWEVAEDMWVKVIHDRPMPVFDLEDVAYLFGYSYEEVCRAFRNQPCDGNGINSTFHLRNEGMFCTIVIPMLLSKVAVVDGRIDEYHASEYVGALGKVIETIMPNGEKYLDAMAKMAYGILKDMTMED